MVAAGSGAWFSSLTPNSGCFWIETGTLVCFFGLSGVVGRALSMGLRAIAIEIAEKEQRRGREREMGLDDEENEENEGLVEGFDDTDKESKILFTFRLKI